MEATVSLPRWPTTTKMEYPNNPRLQPPPINQRYGLGDAVHTAAKPVVMLIKAFGGPDLGKCGACRQRQEKWNKAIPDIRRPFNPADLT